MPLHASHILFEDPSLCTEFDPKTRKYPLGQEIRALKFRAASVHSISHRLYEKPGCGPTLLGCEFLMLYLCWLLQSDADAARHNQRATGAGSETANVSAGYCGEGEEKLPHMGTVAHCK